MRMRWSMALVAAFAAVVGGGRSTARAATCGVAGSAVDQSQLASNGDLVVSAQQVVAQSFVVGRSGILAGVEAGLGACNGLDPAASIVLTVLSNGASVGTASIAATTIGVGACGAFPLSATTRGTGYFDLTAQCIHVTAGQTLTFQLSVISSNGYQAREGMEVPSGTASPYPNGIATVNGMPAPLNLSLTFKTFVGSPAPVPATPPSATLGVALVLANSGWGAIRATTARRPR
jgi:hypothetical protein